MFDLPEAKRVRREDLNASDDGESDDGIQDAELRARLNAQIARSLGLDDSYTQPAADLTKDSHLAGPKGSGDEEAGAPDETGEDAEEEFAFRLFSGAPTTQKVVLEEDVEPTGDGGLVAGRPPSYYMVTNVPTRRKQEYAFAAVSGDQVLERSHDRAWGLELPWKVMALTVTRKARPGEDEAGKGKRRPGKKQRISLRKRSKAREEKKAAEAQRVTEKEEHVKDKKKRMNRLKKLRKRAKAREQKQAGREGGDSDEDSAGSE